MQFSQCLPCHSFYIRRIFCNLGLKNFFIHPCLRVSCLENNFESTMVNHVCCHMLAHVIDLTLRV